MIMLAVHTIIYTLAEKRKKIKAKQDGFLYVLGSWCYPHITRANGVERPGREAASTRRQLVPHCQG